MGSEGLGRVDWVGWGCFGREEGRMVGVLTKGLKGAMGYGVRWVDWSLGQRHLSLLVPRYIKDRHEVALQDQVTRSILRMLLVTDSSMLSIATS